MTPLVVLAIALAFITFPDGSAQAQIFSHHDLYSYSANPETRNDPLTQHSFGGTRFDSTLEFLKRKNEEERERRDKRERERRTNENFSNVPGELLDSYFSRRSPSIRR
jgi:hypothetical protein